MPLMELLLFSDNVSMAKFTVLVFSLILLHKTNADDSVLYPHYYGESCPLVEEIVRQNIEVAVLEDPRMAASLLRLHFHDCFVLGCDASVLLDSTDGIISEKGAAPNLNSLRGFEVIDKIKALLEEACPHTVSCADILAIAARDSTFLRGGPSWEVVLGRRDSLIASFNGANQFIPAPNFTLPMLISSFQTQGLGIEDLVALSGSHTIGRARCLSIRSRIYGQKVDEEPDYYRRSSVYRRILRSFCPPSGGDNVIAPLDFTTSNRFDRNYFLNLLQGKGLLQSDDALISQDIEGSVANLVFAYASNQELFFRDFARSMIRMGNINVLTRVEGEIRRNCRYLGSV